MRINFVGNFQNGYVGEQADQVHLAREMEALGHTVRRVPQDIWKAFCEGESNSTCGDKLPIEADINIITKWHHFVDGSYIVKLREMSKAPVFYWVWDYMDDQGIPEWHQLMAKCADLYLTNEYGIHHLYKPHGVKPYYFPFDVCDGDLPIFRPAVKEYDVVFTGSHLGQGHRIDALQIINAVVPVTIFSWNYEEWQKRGFTAYPAVYGNAYNDVIAKAKIVLGFSVEPNCWGYWSNRVGKVLRIGGCLLYEYAPGMELSLGDAADYFSSPPEAIEKIIFYLDHEEERREMEKRALDAGHRFTSKERIKQLMILADRFIKTGGKAWNY